MEKNKHRVTQMRNADEEVEVQTEGRKAVLEDGLVARVKGRGVTEMEGEGTRVVWTGKGELMEIECEGRTDARQEEKQGGGGQ